MPQRNKVLVLGGTQFIGRSLVERLLEDYSYEVTLFNRQLTGAQLFPQLNKLKGDRETKDIEQIAKQDWDYVIDCSCFYPEALTASLSNVQGPALKKYILISSCSAYDTEAYINEYKTEDTPTLPCNAEQAVDRSPASYGQRKAECERILINSGVPHSILRPALVFGPYDPTDRLYYWLYQVKTSQRLLLPDNGKRRFSITYVHDLVSSILSTLSSSEKMGIFNSISQEGSSIVNIIETASQCLQKKPGIVNATPHLLKSENIAQWMDMPLWINGDHFTYSNEKMRTQLAVSTTSFKESIQTTINYFARLEWPTPNYGITEKTRLHLLEKAIKSGKDS